MAKIVKLEEAVKNIVYVSNSLELKNAVAKESLVIVSTDVTFYEKMLKKFSKEKNAKHSKSWGKFIAATGAVIDVVTAGLFSFIGTPMIVAGMALVATGAVLDEYKEYCLYLNHSDMQVMLIKEKGNPRVRVNEKELNKLTQ